MLTCRKLNSMTDVYYTRRRRLKTLLCTLALSIILLLLVRVGQQIYSLAKYVQENYDDLPEPVLEKPRVKRKDNVRAHAALLLEQSVANGSSHLLSKFEFTNSPYLSLARKGSTIVPIIVLSKAADVEVRDAVRRTWGFDGLYSNGATRYKVFFLVGTDDAMLKRIQAEQRLFDDLIQVSVPDSPSFLAYRELSAMLWMRTYLPKAPFYIKSEAEVSLNMKAIVYRLLPSLQNFLRTSHIIGWFDREHNLDRGVYQKFINAASSPSSMDLYYAMSAMYIVTTEAWNRVLEVAERLQTIQQPGDPFVTGFLREAAHVPMKNLATLTEDFKYEVGGKECKEVFVRDPKLLVCAATSASNRTITDYFSVWNTLFTQDADGGDDASSRTTRM